jgi:hypothetical protein
LFQIASVTTLGAFDCSGPPMLMISLFVVARMPREVSSLSYWKTRTGPNDLSPRQPRGTSSSSPSRTNSVYRCFGLGRSPSASGGTTQRMTKFSPCSFIRRNVRCSTFAPMK